MKTVANLFREMCYGYRDQLSAGIICAGWDKREGGQVQSLGQKRKGVCVCGGGGGVGGRVHSSAKIQLFGSKTKGRSEWGVKQNSIDGLKDSEHEAEPLMIQWYASPCEN